MKPQHYQLDHYAAQAKKLQYRSRAAFKLLELHHMLKLFKPGMKVLDLGAAPGSWSQVAYDLTLPNGLIFGLDILPIQPYKNIIFIQEDINKIDYTKLLHIAQSQQSTITNTSLQHSMHSQQTTASPILMPNLSQHTRLTFDIVLCDICPNKTGNSTIDSNSMHQINLKTIEIAQAALTHNGSLIMKIFQDSHTTYLTNLLSSLFIKTKLIKPNASRKISSEIYYYAQGLKTTTQSQNTPPQL